MYKKILKILIVICSIFILSKETAYAGNDYINIKTNKEENDIILSVNINKDKNIFGFLTKINYDKDKLSLNKCTSANFTINQEKDKILLESITKRNNTNLFTCSFTILKNEETKISLTDITLSDGNVLVTQQNAETVLNIEKEEEILQPDEEQEVVEKEQTKEETKEKQETKENNNIIVYIIIFLVLIAIVIMSIFIYKKKKKIVIPSLLLILVLLTSTKTKAEISVDETKLIDIRDMLLERKNNNNIYDFDNDKKTTINDLILGLIELNKTNITFTKVKTTGTKEYKTSLTNIIELDGKHKINSINYCITTNDKCIPNINYKYDGTNTIKIKYPDNKDPQRLCITIQNNFGVENTICDQKTYKVDATTPKIEVLNKKEVIGEEEKYNPKNNLKIEYGPSGGSYSCTKKYQIGTNTITCIVNGNNGLNTKINYELEVVETYDIIHFVDSLNTNYTNKFVSNDLTILESNGKFAIIDFGYKDNDVDNKKVFDYLEKLNIKEFEFALLTHGHSDHTGFFEDIATKYNIKNIYLKEKVKEYPDSEYYGGYEKVLKVIDKYNIPIKDVEKQENQKIILGEMIIELYNTKFLLDENDISKADNANSVVALINIHGKKIYLASDIGEYGALKEDLDVEVELAKTIGKVDVYKVAHHGYMTYQNSLTALQYLEPTYSIVNNDEESNQIDGLIDRLKFGNENYKKTYFTSNGHVEMTFNSTGTISIKQ